MLVDNVLLLGFVANCLPRFATRTYAAAGKQVVLHSL